MVGLAAVTGRVPKGGLEGALADAPVFEHVNWRTQPNMKKLYLWCIVLCVASATTGYDGLVTRHIFYYVTVLTP